MPPPKQRARKSRERGLSRFADKETVFYFKEYLFVLVGVFHKDHH